MVRRTRLSLVVLASALLASTVGISAQTSGLTRTLVGRGDVSVPGREAVVARVEVAAGSRAGRHTHPGDEISYVTEGQVELLIDGQPPRAVHTGESFIVPAGVVHDAHNSSASVARLVGVYVVEKGKPLASPAP